MFSGPPLQGAAASPISVAATGDCTYGNCELVMAAVFQYESVRGYAADAYEAFKLDPQSPDHSLASDRIHRLRARPRRCPYLNDNLGPTVARRVMALTPWRL